MKQSNFTVSKLASVMAVLMGTVAASAYQPPASFTYQGKLFQADAVTPLQDPSVVFKVQIFSPNGTCLLFEETDLRDMTGTLGMFSLIVGNGTNTNASPLTLPQVLDNSQPMVGAASCSYVPVSGDTRLLRLSYTDAGVTTTLSPDQSIRSVPYAINAMQLEGLEKNQFIQVSAQTTQTKLDTLLTNYTSLMTLAAGGSTTYATSAQLPVSGGVLNMSTGGVQVPDVPTSSSNAVNQNYSDSHVAGKTVDLTGLASGESLIWNAALTKWQVYVPNAGTVTSVGLSLPSLFSVSNSPVTASGTLTATLASQAANTVFAAPNGSAGAPSFRALTATDIPNLNWSKITGVPTTLSGFGITDGLQTSGVPSITAGLDAALPAAGTLGRLYVSTDGKKIYRDNGISWDVLASGSPILPNVGTAGTYFKVTTDAQGRVSSGNSSLAASDVPSLDWSKITSGIPTSLSGYGITDAVKNAGGAVSFQEGADASKPSAGTAGRIYIAQDTFKIYRDNGASWDLIASSSGAGGTVTSVGLTAPSIFSVSGSPVTGSGTLSMSLASQSSNMVFAGPTSGSAAPGFRSLNISDLRSVNTGAFMTGSSCSAGQALTYSSVSDTMSCTTISLSSSQVNTALSSSMSGDSTISSSGVVALKNTGTAGTYSKVTTDAQGRVTSGSALASGDVTTALGFTPGTGSVTSITAGTGLTAATITSSGTINVNVGTGANQIVQLDSSSRLPAVDGSQLTNVVATSAPFKNFVVYPATGTWTVPAGITKVYVEAWGAGGGASGGQTASFGGNGGGAGAYGAWYDTVVPNAVMTVTVGTGGTGGLASSSGTNGGSTSFNVTTINGGSAGTALAPGAGGIGSVAAGVISMSGSSGSNGGIQSITSSVVTVVGINVLGSTTSSGLGGLGGAAARGGGGGIGSASTAVVGGAGIAPGGGGGGGGNTNSSAGSVGGAGAAGRVIIWY